MYLHFLPQKHQLNALTLSTPVGWDSNDGDNGDEVEMGERRVEEEEETLTTDESNPPRGTTATAPAVWPRSFAVTTLPQGEAERERERERNDPPPQGAKCLREGKRDVRLREENTSALRAVHSVNTRILPFGRRNDKGFSIFPLSTEHYRKYFFFMDFQWIRIKRWTIREKEVGKNCHWRRRRL